MTNVIIQTAVVNMLSCAPPRCIVFNADLTNTNRPQHPRIHAPINIKHGRPSARTL